MVYPDRMTVMDDVEKQIRSIEATHRGFLYQHLYATACLIRMADDEIEAVRVELDEDVEIVVAGHEHYVQIKHYKDPVYRSDLESSLARFTSWASGGTAAGRSMRILISSSPAPILLRSLKANVLDDDIALHWPDGPVPPHPLPPVLPSIREAMQWCEQAASKLPLSELKPLSLVMKVVAEVQLAASGQRDGPGHDGHIFKPSDLPRLFEQYLRSLSRTPELQSGYRDHLTNVTFSSRERVRIIAGHSGSGKTTWVAYEGARSADIVIYVDCASVDRSGFVSYLAREIAAVAEGTSGSTFGDIFRPNREPREYLRLASELQFSRPVTVVMDNAHSLAADEAVRLLNSETRVRWLLLGQYSDDITHIAMMMGVAIEPMPAWSNQSILNELQLVTGSIQPDTVARTSRITGGLPLFVRQFAALVQSEYGGDAGRALVAIETATHTTLTAAEVILGRVFASATDVDLAVMGALSLVNSYLLDAEVIKCGADVWGLRESVVAASVRKLSASGYIDRPRQGALRLHDAVRTLVLSSERVSPENRSRCAASLFDQIRPQKGRPLSYERVKDCVSILVSERLDKELVAFAGDASEIIYQTGAEQIAAPVLLGVVRRLGDTVSGDTLLFALEAGAYWALQANNRVEAAKYVEEMAPIALRPGVSDNARGAVALKRLSLRVDSAEIAYGEATVLALADDARRVVDYTYGVALIEEGKVDAGRAVLEKTMLSYAKHLGVTQPTSHRDPQILIPAGCGPAETMEKFADCIDALARTRAAEPCGGDLGQTGKLYIKMPHLAFLHAMKVYGLAKSPTSQLRAGLALADVLLESSKYSESTMVLVGLRPVAKNLDQSDVLVVESMLSVSLAYEKRYEEARRCWMYVEPHIEAAPEPLRTTLVSHAAYFKALLP
jgi:hypothetical protein